MTVAHHLSIGWLTRVLRKPSFWLILLVLVIITLPHYAEALEHPAFLSQLITNLGLDRHAFERVLYLAPIVWAGFLFGWILISKYRILIDGTVWIVHACTL